MAGWSVKSRSEQGAAHFIEEEIKKFVRTSPLNCLPGSWDQAIFDEPLVGFVEGDAPIFTEYKVIIGPDHLTPRQALAKAFHWRLPAELSVISWVLPIAERARVPNRSETRVPSRLWAETRWYGEQFNQALRRHLVQTLTDMAYLAVAPALRYYFRVKSNKKGLYSNWSERHIAYAAGLGTFSLSGGLITERGVAHRCGSVVTDLVLPATPRTASTPYSNCLFYTDGSCRACIARCPAGAISERGQDKFTCQQYQRKEIAYLRKEYGVGVTGCGLCQTNVPCEFSCPTKKG